MRYLRKSFQEVIWVVAFALALAASAYALRPRELPLIPPAKESISEESAKGEIAYIDIKAAMDLFNEGVAVFADARPLQAFNAGHIRGALHLAPQDFDDWSSDVFFKLPMDQMIIAYCDGAQCTLSSELAEKLIWLGYENIAILKDGWRQWQQRRLPTQGHGRTSNP